MRKISQSSSKNKTTTDLYQLAFNNSVHANIISTIKNGSIIMVNRAACKLLGFTEKKLLAKTFSAVFDVKEDHFKKMLKERKATGRSVEIVSAIRSGGRSISCEISSSLFMDNTGIEKSITTITDRSKSIRNQQKIDITKEKIVAENIGIAKSGQRKIDARNKKIVDDNILLAKSKQKKLDIKNAKTVADNIGIAKTGQRRIDARNKKIVGDNILLAKSKQKKLDIKNAKTVADNIGIAKSKQKKLDTKKEKIVARNIIIAKARSDEEKIDYENYGRANMLKEIEESFRIMFNLSSDVLFDSDLVADKGMVNNAYEKEFGYKKNNNAHAEDWATHIHPRDKELVMKDYHRMLASKEIEWKTGYRFLRADKSVATVLSSRIILREPGGKAYRMIGTMQDVSKQKVLEERLEKEIKLKEVQIAEAAEDAKHTERSDIGKELHDNVNQLLSASKMYLEMAKRGGENSKMYLSRSTEYTMAAIEEIRKLTKGLTSDIIKNLGLCEAIENIAGDTMEITPVKISCVLNDFKENSVNDRFKLNVFRIVQEQLSNILKHAKATEVIISLLQNKDSIMLKITDNGIGFDIGKKRQGIGLANIKSRAESYNGMASFFSRPGKGCVLTATFSANDKMLGRV